MIFRMIILPGDTVEENIQYMLGREKGIRYMYLSE